MIQRICCLQSRLELIDENIDRFVGLVDHAYRTSIEREYTGFIIIEGYLLERKAIHQMYDSMVKLFPFIHSDFSLSVSSTGACGDKVCLSKYVTAGSGTIEERKCKDEQIFYYKNGTNTAVRVERMHSSLNASVLCWSSSLHN